MREVIFIIGWSFLTLTFCGIVAVVFGADFDRLVLSAAMAIAIGAHYREQKP